VTGAGGFLGSAIAGTLQQCGYSILGLGRGAPIGAPFRFVRMELPAAEFDDALSDWQPDVLVHAVGSASVADSMARPFEDFQASVHVYSFVLDSLRRLAPQCRVLFLSSAAVYGNPAALPIRESAPAQPVSAYGVHKQMCEELGTAYSRLFGVQTCSLRIFSAYGEGLRRQVVFDVVQKLQSQDEVDLYGTGDESRDFIYVGDVVRAVECVIGSGDYASGVYNLASGVETRIADLAADILRLVNGRGRVRFNGVRRAGDPVRWQADMGRLEALGFAAKWDLRQGLTRVIQHWRAEGK